MITDPSLETNSIVEERREKLKKLREHGNAFPNDFRRDSVAKDIEQKFEQSSKESLEAAAIQVSISGRIMLKRVMGKASFITIQDGSGRIQLYVTQQALGDDAYESFKSWDLGDIVGASGFLFRTKTNELSVRVESLRLLTKSLRPLPEKFHGLTDQETRYRQRYLDLMMNEDSRRVFIQRSQITQSIRTFFLGQGYLEVETPMMHPIPGGAAARPFVTHHNALNRELFLRIAPELYLKKLVIGGFEKVFEINRNFRNEGLSPRHNPEFTMLEFYVAFVDYIYLMGFIETMFKEIAASVLGSDRFIYQNQELDFSKPFARLTMPQAIQQNHPHYSSAQLQDRTFVLSELNRLGAKHDPNMGIGGLHLALFEATTEALLFQPTFIIDYPAEVSPLARRSDSNAQSTDRFELFIAGREIANGFSELNDPEDQAQRFLDQSQQKDAGDHEAMHFDADYIKALEFGLPPTAGAGIGIDRLVMLLTDQASIRDVILFPQLRD